MRNTQEYDNITELETIGNNMVGGFSFKETGNMVKNFFNFGTSGSEKQSPQTKIVEKQSQRSKVGIDLKELVDKLKAGRVNFEVLDKNNNTVLHNVVTKAGDRAYEIVSMILQDPKAKKIINYVNNEGNTALHLAVMNHNDNLVELLIKNGANKAIKNNKDQIVGTDTEGVSDIKSNTQEIKNKFENNNISENFDDDTDDILRKLRQQPTKLVNNLPLNKSVKSTDIEPDTEDILYKIRQRQPNKLANNPALNKSVKSSNKEPDTDDIINNIRNLSVNNKNVNMNNYNTSSEKKSPNITTFVAQKKNYVESEISEPISATSYIKGQFSDTVSEPISATSYIKGQFSDYTENSEKQSENMNNNRLTTLVGGVSTDVMIDNILRNYKGAGLVNNGIKNAKIASNNIGNVIEKRKIDMRINSANESFNNMSTEVRKFDPIYQAMAGSNGRQSIDQIIETANVDRATVSEFKEQYGQAIKDYNSNQITEFGRKMLRLSDLLASMDTPMFKAVIESINNLSGTVQKVLSDVKTSAKNFGIQHDLPKASSGIMESLKNMYDTTSESIGDIIGFNDNKQSGGAKANKKVVGKRKIKNSMNSNDIKKMGDKISRIISRQKDNIHETVIKKIQELLGVDEDTARNYKAGLWNMLKNTHGEKWTTMSSITRAQELEKSVDVKILKKINLKEAAEIRKQNATPKNNKVATGGYSDESPESPSYSDNETSEDEDPFETSDSSLHSGGGNSEISDVTSENDEYDDSEEIDDEEDNTDSEDLNEDDEFDDEFDYENSSDSSIYN
jgi:hypothetical protein